MDEITISTLAEFHEQLPQFTEGDTNSFLYRGQSDAGWTVNCSAARRLAERSPTPMSPYQLIEPLLIPYLEFITDRARLYGFIPPGFNETPDGLELLAQLQHQGAATGLIDFTRQPLVALWFACNEADEENGAVYILPRAATEEIRKREDFEGRKIRSFYEGDKLWSWEPPVRGNRIVAQSSVFIFGVADISYSKIELTKLTILSESKSDILKQLESIYGVNEEILFSDFSGYAVANASNKTFDFRRNLPLTE